MYFKSTIILRYAAYLLIFLMHSSAYAFNLDALSDGQAAFNRGDYHKALTLWRHIAEQGQAEAQLFVGLAYANGWGVRQDAEQAALWYFMAAENKNASAQYLLGLHMFNSDETSRRNMGIVWLKQAATNGDGAAKSFLAKAKQRHWFKVPDHAVKIPVIEVTDTRKPGAVDNRVAIQSLDMPISTQIEL